MKLFQDTPHQWAVVAFLRLGVGKRVIFGPFLTKREAENWAKTIYIYRGIDQESFQNFYLVEKKKDFMEKDFMENVISSHITVVKIFSIQQEG